MEKGKITTEGFSSVDNLSYNTIQKGLLQYQEKINAAVTDKDLELDKHKEALGT